MVGIITTKGDLKMRKLTDEQQERLDLINLIDESLIEGRISDDEHARSLKNISVIVNNFERI